MRPNASARMIVVKKEDKEARLHGFIADFLERSEACGASSEVGLNCLLLARSAESPAVRALSAILATDHGTRLRPRLLLANEDADLQDGAPSAILRNLSIDLRLGRDIRLLEAHEQLVLGDTTVWIGDCMRRDPAARDAFETYSNDLPLMATRARQTFERLWEAVSRSSAPPRAADPLTAIATALAMTQAAQTELQPATVITRH